MLKYRDNTLSMKRVITVVAITFSIAFGTANIASAAVQCGPPGKTTTCNGTCMGNTYCIENPQGSNAPANGALGFYVSRFFQFTLPIVGVLAFLLIMYSGFQYLSSKGDPKGVQAAQLRLTYSIGGLIIIFLAYAILNFVTFIFGLRAP